MSGVVSILFTGITMKHYTHNNISAEAQDMYVAVSVVLCFLHLNLTEPRILISLSLDYGFI